MNYKRSYLFRLACDPVCYLWTGHGWLDVPGDEVDPEGARYIGAAGLLSVPALKALINGEAERVEFGLSGVDQETLRLAMEDRASVDGAEVRLGFVEHDRDWKIVGGVHWEWLGRAAPLTLSSSATDSGRSRTISLSAASADTLRANPPLAFFTQNDQLKRSSDDIIFDHVSGITAGTTRSFGPK